MDDFDYLRRICLLSDLWQSLQRYPLSRNSYWLRFLVAMKQVPVLILHFSLNYSKDFHIEHIFSNRINFSRSDKPRHFFSALPAVVVVCIKIGCDGTGKRYGPMIQP